MEHLEDHQDLQELLEPLDQVVVPLVLQASPAQQVVTEAQEQRELPGTAALELPVPVGKQGRLDRQGRLAWDTLAPDLIL
jgi:hypothetical protein